MHVKYAGQMACLIEHLGPVRILTCCMTVCQSFHLSGLCFFIFKMIVVRSVGSRQGAWVPVLLHYLSAM